MTVSVYALTAIEVKELTMNWSCDMLTAVSMWSEDSADLTLFASEMFILSLLYVGCLSLLALLVLFTSCSASFHLKLLQTFSLEQISLRTQSWPWLSYYISPEWCKYSGVDCENRIRRKLHTIGTLTRQNRKTPEQQYLQHGTTWWDFSTQPSSSAKKWAA